MICDLAEKQRKKEEERRGGERGKDFGMMDGYVKEDSNLHSSLKPSQSVSFFVFQWKNWRERESEREERH